MRIAVNTRLLQKDKLEGIGWFTHETLKRIVLKHPEHEFIFIFDRPWSEEFIYADNVVATSLFPPTRHPILIMIWFELMLPFKLRRLRPDLFLSPDGFLSLASKTPQLGVMHDINFKHYPKHLPPAFRWYYNFFFPLFARKAKRLATVSEFSKADIIAQYGIEQSKIDVVYNGVNPSFAPIAPSRITEVRNRVSGGQAYFIFIGSIQPRKNLPNMLRSFDAFKKASGSSTKMVIVGEKKWWNKELRRTFDEMEFKGDVIFTGRLNETELNEALAASIGLVYISFFEGFGIPIIEAMRCEVPVITSNITSMPEIAADAAMLVSPFDVGSIAAAMQMIDEDDDLRADLIEKGKARCRDFSWEKTADALWKSVIKASAEA